MIKLSGNLRSDFDRVFEEYMKLKDRMLGCQESIKSLQNSLKASENITVSTDAVIVEKHGEYR